MKQFLIKMLFALVKTYGKQEGLNLFNDLTDKL